MNPRAEALKQAYHLQAHPEGGWFAEMYTAPFVQQGRATMGSIYFLLAEKDISHFHQIDCDEMWYYHEGGALRITLLMEEKWEVLLLGGHPERGERAAVLLPAGAVFAAEMADPTDYCFLSCATTPAFRYEGFRLIYVPELRRRFPACSDQVEYLAFPAPEGTPTSPGEEICFLTEKSQIWSDMLSDVLEQNHIPFDKRGTLGAGMTVLAGPMLETYRFYVPAAHYAQAAAIVEELFGGGNTTETEEQP